MDEARQIAANIAKLPGRPARATRLSFGFFLRTRSAARIDRILRAAARAFLARGSLAPPGFAVAEAATRGPLRTRTPRPPLNGRCLAGHLHDQNSGDEDIRKQ